MTELDALSPALAAAFQSRGYTSLTPIQEAVLDPAHAGRDLRLFSQTGSGKTVAIGLVLAPDLERIVAERASATPPSAPSAAATPATIVIAPTRELAAQLARELSWLFRPLGASVCAVTGGTSIPQELYNLRQGPLVVVGTPGRLVDHLERGAIDPSRVCAAVLDEADQMLDMGFREELETILGKMPEARRTHLVAATFSREVSALANRYQKDAIAVEGTSLGEANQDITHVAHLVKPDERDAAVVNLLLLAPTDRALVFVRTREGASELAERLGQAGFSARALSGELEQRERTRTLAAFRSGAVTTLVATDVAARGLDIPDVNRVIHADPPSDPETFTHRSGRTGRAGRKGTSVMLVPPQARDYVARLFRGAGIRATWSPAPSPDDVLREADARLAAELRAPAAEPADPRLQALAASLLADMDPAALVTTLLARSRHTGPSAPLAITPLVPHEPLPRRPPEHRAPRNAPNAGAFVPFQVSWGGRHGADPRRLLALVCRRGGIRSDQVGAIHVGDFSSSVEVATPVASDFARSAARPDERDPRVRIRPMPEFHGETAPRSGPAPRPRGRGPLGGDEPPRRFRHPSLTR
ncbi:DEAD/DEAH box helicase [Polyangium mundeleinium]|uniref:DEAD/DEAH box helicase n=1 Tax=Polyangium mundeleinium TaxID=2995306 RepID=A0ABT5ETE2_9BACT|nr:DEAD/DEAH box helicase [Polyangium mundeleinium]MDC0744468.1 DEAD/DEAH box helicase [Polyangium mundeleinium]